MRVGPGTTATAALAAALAGRYVVGRNAASRHRTTGLERTLGHLGAVDSVTIMPVVERLTRDPGLRGEAGVSYLLRADGLTLLFDCGLGMGRGETPFETNARALGVHVEDLDCLVVSHLHLDHVGGARSQLRHTFSLGREQPLPASLPAFVPTDMEHPRADVCVVEEARVLGTGVAVLPPLRRMLFWLGPVAEQALVVNVRNRGLVVLTGCGHPEIEKTLAEAEQIVDAPVYAVIGGLHLPVHAAGTPLMPQAILGSPNWPWRPISEGDARAVIASIRARGPGLVALSAHDSTPWTLAAFDEAFGAAHQALRVGEEITIRAG
ncbi:MBL fold metallo-hydrolase [Nocardioides mesophilus]|uniref:MBL fold metallo-hydrolase n=1 Tax=Nocardioides mesophilus TaxID=433659 RepID=A0A7G9RES5_9ACTN|nr:MBL fold metallo-hydrolase [Nocardioides mesophilus]QNN54100.1 MBL fold metallo-hydrolase [Nocardioides mesophilus]